MNYALLVDDVEMNLDILTDLLEGDFDILTASDGKEALKLMEWHWDEIAVVLLDLMMPELDGFGVLEAMKQNDSIRQLPVLVITGEDSPEVEAKCLAYGVSDFVRKPFNQNTVRLRAKNAARLFALTNHLSEKVAEQTAVLTEQNRRLRETNENIVAVLGAIVESRDQESGDHILRVRDFTRILAEDVMENYPEYGLNPENVRIMSVCSMLHDVGKIKVSDTILLKPGKLTDEEFREMQNHTVYGREVLEKAAFMWDEDYRMYCEEICNYHHERFDGRGYPEKLKGEEIPISAQIVALADCFDALTTERVYKAAYTPQVAYEMLQTGQCGVFSPKLLASLERCQDRIIEQYEKNTRK